MIGRMYSSVVGHTNHPACHDTLSLDGLSVASPLRPKRLTGFIRRCERIEAIDRPVLQHAVENSLDVFRLESLDVGAAGVSVPGIAKSHEEIHRAIVIDCA